MSTFKIPIQAVSVEEALVKTDMRSRSPRLITDTVADVRHAVETKLQRVQENPRLYADKIAEYQEILAKLQRMESEGASAAMIVAEGMLAHGDTRVSVRSLVGVIAIEDGCWFVFGVA